MKTGITRATGVGYSGSLCGSGDRPIRLATTSATLTSGSGTKTNSADWFGITSRMPWAYLKRCLYANAPLVAVENPMPARFHKSPCWPVKLDQIVHPWITSGMESYRKATHLWLRKGCRHC